MAYLENIFVSSIFITLFLIQTLTRKDLKIDGALVQRSEKEHTVTSSQHGLQKPIVQGCSWPITFCHKHQLRNLRLVGHSAYICALGCFEATGSKVISTQS